VNNPCYDSWLMIIIFFRFLNLLTHHEKEKEQVFAKNRAKQINVTVHVIGIGNWKKRISYVTGSEGFDDACSSALEILEYVFHGATSRFHSQRTWKRGRLGSHHTAQTQLYFTKFRERRENKRNAVAGYGIAAFEYSGVKFISFAWWTMNHLPSILCARFHYN